MLIEQIIEFKLREQGRLGRTWTPKLVIFITKQKSLQGDLQMDYYLLLKYCRRQCYFSPPPTSAKLLTKVKTKMQDFQLALDLNCKFKEDWTT